ncbi:MAG: peptide-methionine (R)-S-oxide reductase MsrB [Pseudomonadota bacterium]
MALKVEKSEAEWKEELTPEQFRVLRKHGTERAGTSPLDHEKRDGVFICAGCNNKLFRSEAKFDSGTGWPSFFQPIEPAAVTEHKDRSFFMVRTEIRCADCDGHLGHVFNDGPQPTGLRYCMNGVAMHFVADEG